MKKLIITLVLVFATVMNVSAMSKYRASREARYLTDKMAWELDLSYGQMEDVYEINYDYFRSLVSIHSNYSFAYELRNEELSFVLSPRQWARFIAIEYFFVPVHVHNYSWFFPVHNHYRKDHFYYDAPYAYSHYSGSHASNRDYYKGRLDIHKHDHEHGYKPHTSGNIAPSHGMTRQEVNNHRNQQHAATPSPAPQGNHLNNGNNNVKPQGGLHGNNGNVNDSHNRNQQHNSVPNRTTPNRAANTRTNNTRTNSSSNSSARPTRSQNTQNSSSKGTTSGRR